MPNLRIKIKMKFLSGVWRLFHPHFPHFPGQSPHSYPHSILKQPTPAGQSPHSLPTPARKTIMTDRWMTVRQYAAEHTTVRNRMFLTGVARSVAAECRRQKIEPRKSEITNNFGPVNEYPESIISQVFEERQLNQW